MIDRIEAAGTWVSVTWEAGTHFLGPWMILLAIISLVILFGWFIRIAVQRYIEHGRLSFDDVTMGVALFVIYGVAISFGLLILTAIWPITLLLLTIAAVLYFPVKKARAKHVFVKSLKGDTT